MLISAASVKLGFGSDQSYGHPDVGVVVGVRVGVGERVGVLVGVCVSVTVGVRVGVRVAVAVQVEVRVGWPMVWVSASACGWRSRPCRCAGGRRRARGRERRGRCGSWRGREFGRSLAAWRDGQIIQDGRRACLSAGKLGLHLQVAARRHIGEGRTVDHLAPRLITQIHPVFGASHTDADARTCGFSAAPRNRAPTGQRFPTVVRRQPFALRRIAQDDGTGHVTVVVRPCAGAEADGQIYLVRCRIDAHRSTVTEIGNPHLAGRVHGRTGWGIPDRNGGKHAAIAGEPGDI